MTKLIILPQFELRNEWSVYCTQTCLKRTSYVCKWIHLKIFTNALYEYWREQNNSRKYVRPEGNSFPPHFVCGSMTKVWIWCLITWYHHVYHLLTVETKKYWLSWFIGWCHICRTGTVGLLTPKVKLSSYRPGVTQTVGRGTALFFHDRGTRRGWVVSSTPWPHFTLGKVPVPILQEARCAPGSAWTGGKSRPHRHSIPDRPVRSQSLQRVQWTLWLGVWGIPAWNVTPNFNHFIKRGICNGLLMGNFKWTIHSTCFEVQIHNQFFLLQTYVTQ